MSERHAWASQQVAKLSRASKVKDPSHAGGFKESFDCFCMNPAAGPTYHS